jgi:hypothetical protein
MYSTWPSAPQGQSDELYIPDSIGLLGSFPPYRGLLFPSNMSCFECGAFRQHYATECPARFVHVRGEAPPGWRVDQLGAVIKDSAAWNGPDLTDAVRAQFRAFVDKLSGSLVAHGTYPVSRDEILGPAPVPPRRPLPRPQGGRTPRQSVARGPRLAKARLRRRPAGPECRKKTSSTLRWRAWISMVAASAQATRA